MEPSEIQRSRLAVPFFFFFFAPLVQVRSLIEFRGDFLASGHPSFAARRLSGDPGHRSFAPRRHPAPHSGGAGSSKQCVRFVCVCLSCDLRAVLHALSMSAGGDEANFVLYGGFRRSGRNSSAQWRLFGGPDNRVSEHRRNPPAKQFRPEGEKLY